MAASPYPSPDPTTPLATALPPAGRRAHEQDALYQMLEQTPGYVVILRGPEHRVEYFNPAFQQLYAGRELLGRPVSETQPEAVRQGYVALLDQVYNTGKIFQASEVFGQVEDAAGGPARQQYFDVTYQAVRENGQVVGISVFSFDVTERVRLRQQHMAQQAQLLLLFEQVPMAVAILLVTDYLIEVVNPPMARLLERTAAQVVGKPLLDALPEMRGQYIKERLDLVVAQDQAFVGHELAVQLVHEGQLKSLYFDFVYQPLHDVSGLLTRIAVVATDVTERVLSRQQFCQANTELDATNQQLRRTNADLDNFIYTASHDLKAPISNIEGLLTALREELALPPAEAEVPPLLNLMEQ